MQTDSSQVEDIAEKIENVRTTGHQLRDDGAVEAEQTTSPVFVDEAEDAVEEASIKMAFQGKIWGT